MIFLRNRKQLEALECQPVNDNYHERIHYLANHDAPLDYLIAGELAQLQTFGIPSICKILRRTGQYEHHGTKRLDDTRAILIEIMRDSVHSERGVHMVKHLNWIHSHYDISNDDYLYTLALFIFEPDRWMQAFGYRPLSDDERQAAYLSFRDLGEAMHIKNIPGSYDAFKSWYVDYRQNHLVFHPDNAIVASGLIEGMKPMLPKLVRPFVHSIMCVLINDAALLNALGIKPPSRQTQVVVRSAMAVRRMLLKVFNPWQSKAFENGKIASHYPTYPDGYESHCLGPDKVVRRAPLGSGCPYRQV
ncbi:Uncharacterised protein [BD1-7 clade bacterium]|uniref:ER-bound oxygenase mpaB/mpaB'/Rubber oxygenase catalytic domain-containing protein n=1 Tax=BD1-7 clade bacterium TaxID=2029982 RepID=A0A5S9PYK3_9GAMM|nr:Uncharacterised protein [BD1-7 clade bacterium]CAA0112940.1 Uncharacterised protein [BD1-7 clade bacterium]